MKTAVRVSRNGSCSSRESSSCGSFNNLVGGLRARLAPFAFLANMSVLLLLARAIGAIIHLLPSISSLLGSLRAALQLSQCQVPLPVLLLVLVPTAMAALNFMAARSSPRTEYGGPIRDYVERCFAASGGQLSSVAAAVDEPFSDDEVYFDAVAQQAADPSAPKAVGAAMASSVVRVQLAIPEACNQVVCVQESGREAPRPTAPLWEHLATSPKVKERDLSRRPYLPICLPLKVEDAAEEDDDDDNLCRQVDKRFMYYYSPSGDTRIYPSSPSRLDSLSPREVYDEFSQFRSRGWAKIRGKTVRLRSS